MGLSDCFVGHFTGLCFVHGRSSIVRLGGCCLDSRCGPMIVAGIRDDVGRLRKNRH
jgi:hypothetical protein